MTPRILIVEDDDSLREHLRDLFEEEAMAVSEAADGVAAVETAQRERPDLILLDLGLPLLSGAGVHEQLRTSRLTRDIPIVVLSAYAEIDRKIERLSAGADDYVTKPFAVGELTARVRAALRRTATLRDLSPLTGLPGNAAIMNEIHDRIAAGQLFALLHIDLDEFKCFNDRYGFAAGDRAIATVAAALEAAIERRATTDFIGHIGGDDFLVMTERQDLDTQDLDTMARRITVHFDHIAPSLHEEEDRSRGWYEATDRRGDTRRLPLMTVSIGIARSTGRRDENPGQLAHIAGEMKNVAKGQPGSSWAIDRRERG